MKNNSESTDTPVQNHLKMRQAFNELIQKKSRLLIILNLFAYSHLTLSDLADAVGKSKPTISRDLSTLVSAGLVKEIDIPSQHGNTKSFALTPSFLEENALSSMTPEIFTELTSDQRKNLFDLAMSFGENSVFLLKHMLDQIQTYIDSFRTRKRNLDIPTPEVFQSWMNEFGVTLRMMPMKQELFQTFIGEYVEFLKQFQKKHSYSLSDQLSEADYLIWSLFVPLKKIIS